MCDPTSCTFRGALVWEGPRVGGACGLVSMGNAGASPGAHEWAGKVGGPEDRGTELEGEPGAWLLSEEL